MSYSLTAIGRGGTAVTVMVMLAVVPDVLEEPSPWQVEHDQDAGAIEIDKRPQRVRALLLRAVDRAVCLQFQKNSIMELERPRPPCIAIWTLLAHSRQESFRRA